MKTLRLFSFLFAVAAVLTVGGVLAIQGQGPILPPPDANPLNQTAVPEPPNLGEFVKSKPAAIRLGKAFFWDMQVGSDGVQACASCHFSAGADNRLKNTVNPGPDGAFQVTVPNGTLQPADFPFHQRQAPADAQASPVLRNSNDIVGSQGVRRSQFVDVVPGSAVDNVTPVPDPVFNAGGANVRRVTGRNTPTVINAIFNFANFWDGRANFLFNGQNPFGPADPNAGVWFNDGGQLVKRPVVIQFASLASQATGPPMDATEMSGAGRTFPQLGRKMLSLVPLGKQLVHPGDSVLGPLSKAVLNQDGTITRANGLNATYSQMIRDAFQDNLWSSTQTVSITLPSGQAAQFSQMEANFSLYWGLAIQLYEATLVSDQTPLDRWFAGESAALTDQQKLGFEIFNGIGKCGLCHEGIEFTNASAGAAKFLNNAAHKLIEEMFVANGTRVIYDEGYNNTAVTPTTDDAGRGGTAPFTNTLTGAALPLSFSRLALLQRQNLLPFSSPILDPAAPTLPANVMGAFKAPGLRNVELTAPYFHNGSVMTLEDVVDFYVRGGNFPSANLADLDPDVGHGLPLMQGNQATKAALVAFMRSLTDPRVKNQSAPFDHPELFIPNGDPEVLLRIPATNLNGLAAPAPSLTINPVASPTNQTTRSVSGTVGAGLTPSVTVNTSATVGPVTVTGTNWSAQVSGLPAGASVITVSVVDAASVQTTLTATVTVDTVAPTLAIGAAATPTRNAGLTLSGTVEAGAVVQVSLNGGAPALASVIGTTWSLPVTLVAGSNAITVAATDAAGNVATQTASIVLDVTPPAITINAVTSPTTAAAQTISGTVEAGATVTVSLNSGPAAAATVTATSWSFAASLNPGSNTISVTAADAAGNTAAAAATISLVFQAPTSLTLTLQAGWNLLSTPVKLSAAATRLDQVFDAASIANIEIMYRWSAGQWVQVDGHYELLPLDALYVKVRAGVSAVATLVPSADLSTPPARNLVAGLNLVGPAPAFEAGVFPARPLDQALVSLAQAANGARGYSIVVSPGHNQPGWTYVLGGQAQSLLPFKGYWVILENPDTMFGFSTTPVTAQ